MRLIEVKSLAGSNFLRADLVAAIQTSPTGTSVILMENGASVSSSEATKEIASRVEAALLAKT